MCLTHVPCVCVMCVCTHTHTLVACTHTHALDFPFRHGAVKPNLGKYAIVRFENLLSIKHVRFIVLSCFLEVFEVLSLRTMTPLSFLSFKLLKLGAMTTFHIKCLGKGSLSNCLSFEPLHLTPKPSCQ